MREELFRSAEKQLIGLVQSILNTHLGTIDGINISSMKVKIPGYPTG
jgi:hypothetical protein